MASDALISEFQTPWQAFLEKLTPMTRQQLAPLMADVEAPRCQWYVLICADGVAPLLRQFADVGSARQAIMAAWPDESKLLTDDIAIFVFFGLRVKITLGDPFMLLPTGILMPLRDESHEIELSEDGYIGRRQQPQVVEVSLVEPETEDEPVGDSDWGDPYDIDADAEYADEDEAEPIATADDEVSEEEPD